jgi:hypothetical protein
MSNTPSSDDLDVWYQQVRSIVKHPAFQKTLAEIKSLPFNEGLQVAFTQMTPDVLTVQNVPIPKGTIISIRAFQDATALTADKPLIQIRAMICLPWVPQWFDLLLLSSDGALGHSPNW